MRVIITGVTGFIGSELTRRLAWDPEISNIQLIIRPLPGLSCEDRFARLERQWQISDRSLSPQQKQKIHIRSLDIGRRLNTDKLLPADIMIHLAASTSLGDPISLARRHNLFSTQNALHLAQNVRELSRFVHVSTAYVAGKRRGLISESMASLNSDFHNPYERSKLESEKCVESSGLNYSIIRPSIVVGRSSDGFAPKMQVLYSAWRAWLSGCLPRAPLDPKGWVDLIPLDFACDGIRALANHPMSLGKTLHLCAGPNRTRSLDILETACRVFNQTRPKLAPPWIVDYLRVPWVARYLPHNLRSMIEVMRWHVPYLGMANRIFDTKKTNDILNPLGITCPSFSDYGQKLFEYLQQTSWGKRPTISLIPAHTEGKLCSV